jgi:hypothetical protein
MHEVEEDIASLLIDIEVLKLKEKFNNLNGSLDVKCNIKLCGPFCALCYITLFPFSPFYSVTAFLYLPP